ncbi:LRP2 [Mytilus edulis]|uniref:LRP2 n=1 Tax=Mytilus edulis TaxID=6550 RepID=A0A8S3SQ55_MYTED|nr:LRP2 [Mytilus edulis]
MFGGQSGKSTFRSRQEKLLFSTQYNLKEFDLDTGVVKELANHSTHVYSIAYDVKGKYVYVPRILKNVIDRFPYPNDQGVNLEIVVAANNPYYVAFDSRNSHLYWTESMKIMRCDTDGSNVTTIVSISAPVSLALDPHNRVTFDGTDIQVVVNHAGLPIDIQVDFVDKRIYWMEYSTGALKSALYNGSDVKTVISTNVISNNREIDIGSDYLFYTSNNKILKIHKSAGQMPEIVHTETTQIFGLILYKHEVISQGIKVVPLLIEIYNE